MSNPKIAVVVATIREPSLARFLAEWSSEFADMAVELFIVEDNPRPSFAVAKEAFPFVVHHCAWDRIEDDLGREAWIIPRRTSAIKSYGFLQAYRAGANLVITLDDDCYPTKGRLDGFPAPPLVATHTRNLYDRAYKERSWVSTTVNIRPRGLPYEWVERDVPASRVLISHGLWANVPDLDGRTQTFLEEIPHVREYFTEQLIERGVFFPMSGMNLAFKRELTPAMYFTLMGSDRNEKPWGFHRFDDIWAGLFAKKILDHLGYRAHSGQPLVWHDRASNEYVNCEQEKPGIAAHEQLCASLDSVVLSQDTIRDCYAEIAQKLPLQGRYWDRLKEAMTTWSTLYA